MIVYVNGVLHNSKDKPIGVKFTVAEMKKIAAAAKSKGELVHIAVPKGKKVPAHMKDFQTLNKHRAAAKEAAKEPERIQEDDNA